MNFAEHGLFEVKTEGKILLVNAIGPFNEELLIKYENTLESCIQNLESSQWNQIITLQELSLFTPEAEKILTKTLINRSSRGLSACAVVFQNIEAESLIEAQMSRCYKNAKVSHMFSNSIDEAKKCLNSSVGEQVA